MSGLGPPPVCVCARVCFGGWLLRRALLENQSFLFPPITLHRRSSLSVPTNLPTSFPSLPLPLAPALPLFAPLFPTATNNNAWRQSRQMKTNAVHCFGIIISPSFPPPPALYALSPPALPSLLYSTLCSLCLHLSARLQSGMSLYKPQYVIMYFLLVTMAKKRKESVSW